MVGQSITFDFLTRGADRTASGFRKVGDNTVLAARGAKVLADAIEKLGKKEDRTAAESAILAKALRQTGDAEDRVAARAVLADAAVRRLDDDMKAAAKKREAELKVKVDDSELKKALGGLKGPGLLGPAVALAPAAGVLAGVAGGAAAGLAGAFIAGGLALSAFGAVAKPVLTDAKKAADAVGKAQDAYNVAIANGVPPAKAFKAEQLAIAKAYAGMSPAQIALSRQLGDMASSWDKVKAAQTPVVAGALQPWLKSVTGLTGALGPIIGKIAPVIASLGGQFNSLVNSSAFKGFRDFIGSTGSAAVSAGGSTIIDLVKSFMILLPKFDPLIREAVGWISRLGPAVLTWASSKKASDDITRFMQWFSKNGPVVGGLLKNIGGALKALAPGLTSGGALELQVISGFLGFVAKLPPGLAKPLAEVAGALLILNKMGVVSVGVKLLGLGGAGGAASAAGAAAGGAAAGGLWSKILPGAKLIGGALVISLIIDQVLENKKNPKVLGNTNPNSPWNSWTSNNSLGGKAINAIAGLFHHATVSIQADFAAQGKAAGSAQADVGVLTQAITHNGNASGEAHTARAALISDMTKAGVNAATAQADVMNYSNAVQANGAKSSQAATARSKLISDILAASSNAKLGRDDLAAFTVAVQSQGSRSDAARAARTRLITDLENSGVNAKTAKALVDGLQTSIDKLHGKNVPVGVTGSGSGGVVITTSGIAAAGQGNVRFHAAAGAFIRAGSGPTADDVPAMLSRGELVVPAHMVAGGAVDHLRGRIPGFAAGGFAGAESALGSMVGTAAGVEGRGAAAAMAAGVKAALAKARAAAASVGGASGSAIADYAMSWLGKIPYVWGGTAVPGGADCSGFTQAVYRKFGISAPRTSEAQGAWVRRTGPVPGGLAFYHSPAGGADPGHVAIVRSGSQVISQGGGMGPTLIPLRALPLLWTGVPPGGLGAGGGGGVAGTGQMSPAAVARLWTADGGPAFAAANMARIAMAESGDRPGAVQTGQPPGLTGYGLYQITPTSGIRQNGPYGNLLNASNNTRAAISLFSQSGYQPWAADPVGAGLVTAGHGGNRLHGAAGAFVSAGRIPGFASGGTVGRQGAAYLKAWKSRHGGGYGAAWGPIPVNAQIDTANRVLGRDTTLAHASLPASQHKHYVAAAAWWKRHRDALVHERGVMRDWRGQLGGSDAAITGWIAAAGTNKALAPPVKRWKGQRAFQEKEIAAVSGMLGWSAAQKAAIAKAHPPVKGKPPPVTGVQATHSYGGDVANNIGTVLAAALGPFTGAARGGMVFDRGGTLAPGYNAVWNKTGRPEPLVPAGGGGGVHLHLTVNGPVGSQQQLEDWFVRTANKTAQHGRLSQAVKAASR